ncbi:MAG: hypothetical protein VXZ53_15760, partial [Planctomycetota bacterium]|nr:hypothetical protein [Planctomycetota bacterium]
SWQSLKARFVGQEDGSRFFPLRFMGLSNVFLLSDPSHSMIRNQSVSIIKVRANRGMALR